MSDEERHSLKIMTWNVNGIRSLYKNARAVKEGLDALNADIICFQETKVARASLDQHTALVDGYNSYYGFPRSKSGYSGVATYCKDSVTPFRAEEGLSGLFASSDSNDSVGFYGNIRAEFSKRELKELDFEGRAVITQHKIKINSTEQTLTLINVYCPRAEEGNEERLQIKVRFYHLLEVRTKALLESGSHVIIVGDFNTAHKPIDHCDPSDMMEMITLLIFLWSTSGIVDGISVTATKSSGNLDSSSSFSMPVQYSMAAPAVASAKMAAASLTSTAPSLTSVAPSYRRVSTTTPISITSSSPSIWAPKLLPQRQNHPVPPKHQRRTSFDGGAFLVSQFPKYKTRQGYESDHEHSPIYIHSSPPRHHSSSHHYQSSPHYQSSVHYETPITYHQLQSSKLHALHSSPYHSSLSHSSPHHHYHEPHTYSKPHAGLLSLLSKYHPHTHSGLMDFQSHKGGIGGSGSFYKFMFPLALLGISLPALGMMYTYLSRRRRRDFGSHPEDSLRPNLEDLDYYLNILQESIRNFQEDLERRNILPEN